MPQKYTTEFVQSVFRDRGVEPLFKAYGRAHDKLHFRCSCPEGRIGAVSWASLYMRKLPDGSAPVPRCDACQAQFKREVAKRPEIRMHLELRQTHSTESVHALFKSRGVTALGPYVALGTSLDFQCMCGRVGKTTVETVVECIRKNPEHRIRCRSCITRDWKDGKSDEVTARVKSVIRERGAEPLFETFPGLHAPLQFRCACGQEHTTSWDSLKDLEFARCTACHDAGRPRGETHPNWNPEMTDEERARYRNIRAGWQLQKWYADVKQAANFVCALSGQVGGELASHHIAWVARHEDKMLDLDNGVCIAAWLHVLFHRLYPRDTPDEIAAWQEFCFRYRAGEFHTAQAG